MVSHLSLLSRGGGGTYVSTWWGMCVIPNGYAIVIQFLKTLSLSRFCSLPPCSLLPPPCSLLPPPLLPAPSPLAPCSQKPLPPPPPYVKISKSTSRHQKIRKICLHDVISVMEMRGGGVGGGGGWGEGGGGGFLSCLFTNPYIKQYGK